MKKLIALSILATTVWATASNADDFFDGLIVSEDMKREEIGESGQLKAGEILDRKPTILKVDKKRVTAKEVQKEEVTPVIREPAPFGLKWLATVAEIEYIKIKLTPIEVKDNPNSYIATDLPKTTEDFREIIVSFGEDDALWRIAAYSIFMEDDDKASKGVEEFNRYYTLLEKKYGNAQQFFTPASVNVEENITNEDGSTSTQVTAKPIGIGEEGFLQSLMSGEATLYATFENGRIGVTLALLADGQGQTYIAVDYKNLTIEDKSDEELFDVL